MSEAAQTLSIMAGTNSIFTGEELLIATNAGDDKDAGMLAKLGLVPMEAEEPIRASKPASTITTNWALTGGSPSSLSEVS